MRSVIELDDLPHTEHSHELVGADHGNVPASLILAHSALGAGPALRRHRYAEVFVVESGQATFQLGESQIIHCAPAFKTDWVSAPDPVWVSPPKVRRAKL